MIVRKRHSLWREKGFRVLVPSGCYQEEGVLGAVEGGEFLVDLLGADVIVGNDFDVVTAWGGVRGSTKGGMRVCGEKECHACRCARRGLEQA